MIKDKYIKWYLILGAPILAKIIEWTFQIFTGVWVYATKSAIVRTWLIQIIFIDVLAVLIYILFFEKSNLYKLTFIVGIVYFLKELWNFLFITQVFNIATAIAMIMEPVFMWAICGYLPYKLLVRERCR